MKLSKVILTGVVGLVSLGLAACGGGGSSSGSTPATDGGSGEQIVFKLAFNQTDQHPQYKAGVEFGKRLEEATDGRYSIKVYPNEQLGTQSDVIQNLSNGTVELMYVGGPVMEGFNKDFAVYNLPYMFDSVDAQHQIFRDTELNADLFKSVEESKNITVLAALFAGVRNIYNSKQAVRTPDDLTGMKIRVQQSDMFVALVSALGANATPMPFGEVYSALQTGVIDGAENNWPSYESTRHFEVSKFYSVTEHSLSPEALVMSKKSFDKFNAADQAIIKTAAKESVAKMRELWDAREKASEAKVKAGGAQINQVDKKPFIDAMKPVYDKFVTDPKLKDMVAAIQAVN